MIYLQLTTKNKILKLTFFIKFFFSNRSKFQFYSKITDRSFVQSKIRFHFRSKSIIAKKKFLKCEKSSFYFRLKLITANVFWWYEKISFFVDRNQKLRSLFFYLIVQKFNFIFNQNWQLLTIRHCDWQKFCFIFERIWKLRSFLFFEINFYFSVDWNRRLQIVF